MADRAIRQDHVVAEHALLDSAEMGLYFAQAVSRFDGESKFPHADGQCKPLGVTFKVRKIWLIKFA